MAESMIARVRRGAALLDKKRRSKAWRKKIDLKRLYIASFCDCIGGQLYGGNYANAPEWFQRSDAFVAQPDEDRITTSMALTSAWKQLLS